MVHFGVQQKTAPPNIAEIPNKIAGDNFYQAVLGGNGIARTSPASHKLRMKTKQESVSVVFIMLGIVEMVWFFEATIWVMLIFMKCLFIISNPSFPPNQVTARVVVFSDMYLAHLR